MAIQLPAKLSENGLKADHARAINQLIEAVRRVQLVAGPGQRVEQNANGTTLKTPVMSSTVQTSEESWFY
tara:strand:+ start:837 stop:1046 length:210 start_codon:yes stop_codon:yes gene_type:complete